MTNSLRGSESSRAKSELKIANGDPNVWFLTELVYEEAHHSTPSSLLH